MTVSRNPEPAHLCCSYRHPTSGEEEGGLPLRECLLCAGCGDRMLQISRLMLVTSQEGDRCSPIFLMRNVRFADLDEPAWSGHQAGAPSSLPFSQGEKSTEALPPTSATHPLLS